MASGAVRVRLRYHDAPGMYGLKRYALDLLAALPGAGIDVRPSPARIREVRLSGRAVGGLVTKRLSNLLPPLGGGLVHCADHHSLPTFGRADVATVHDLIAVAHPDLVARGEARAREDLAAVRRAVRQGTDLVVPSGAVQDDLRRLAGAEATVVHHGIRHDRFFPDPGPCDAVRPGRLNVLVAMNADLRKRADLVLEAALQVPGVHVIQVGRRHAAPDVARRLREVAGLEARLAGEGRYVRIEHIDDAALRRLYSTVDVVAHPSHAEGFSLPPLEALACGAGVLASDIPVHREVLGDAASLLPLDAAAWTELLARLADGTARLPARADRLRRAAAFTWEKAAREYAMVYAAV